MKNPSPKRVNIYATMSKTMISLAAKMSIVYKIRLLSGFGLSRALAVDHDSNTLGIIIMHNMVSRDVSDIEAEYVSAIILFGLKLTVIDCRSRTALYICW